MLVTDIHRMCKFRNHFPIFGFKSHFNQQQMFLLMNMLDLYRTTILFFFQDMLLKILNQKIAEPSLYSLMRVGGISFFLAQLKCLSFNNFDCLLKYSFTPNLFWIFCLFQLFGTRVNILIFFPLMTPHFYTGSNFCYLYRFV